MSLEKIGIDAKEAARKLAILTSDEKNLLLVAIAAALRENSADILQANAIDVVNGRGAGLSESLIDRLSLTESRVEAMADGFISVSELQDPIGICNMQTNRPNGLKIRRVVVPLGVIGIIYEARPNVTADAAALCLKTGNAVILRGGKEAINSNKAIANVMRCAIAQRGLPQNAVTLIEDTNRSSAMELMCLSALDVLIPRGGAGLIRSVVENAKVPVIETGIGNCHAFVDDTADIDMASRIIHNAKCSRPSVCNSLESVLVHSDIADEALAKISQKLRENAVEIRGCERCCKILGDGAVKASEEDYAAEFSDYIISIRVVDSLDEAIDHIAKYSSGHSECIITENKDNAAKFLKEVDSAAVYVNASTRFTDGSEFGFGAEIGISTQKIHARGPMGLEQLTSVKYIIEGNGQIR